MERLSTGIRDGNHAFLVGIILGTLQGKEIEAEPEMVEDDYTNRIVIHRSSGDYRVTVEPA